MKITRIEVDCIRHGLGKSRIRKYKLIYTKLGSISGASIDSWTKDHFENVFLWLHNSDLAPDTKRTYWAITKKLVKWYRPDLVQILPNYRLRAKPKRKTYDEILTLEEINNLLAHASSHRSKALIAVNYETGCRPGELINLCIKDVAFHEHGSLLSLNGKTGPRTILVVQCTGLLHEYLSYHSFRNDPKAPLFFRADKKIPKPLSYTGLIKILRNAANLAGIKKRIYPYILRHSRISHISPLMTDQEKKQYFGWTPDSIMPSIYEHISNESANNKILEINGVKPPSKQLFILPNSIVIGGERN